MKNQGNKSNKGKDYENNINEMLSSVDVNKVMKKLSESVENLDKSEKEELNNIFKDLGIKPKDLLNQIDGLIENLNDKKER